MTAGTPRTQNIPLSFCCEPRWGPHDIRAERADLAPARDGCVMIPYPDMRSADLLLRTRFRPKSAPTSTSRPPLLAPPPSVIVLKRLTSRSA